MIQSDSPLTTEYPSDLKLTIAALAADGTFVAINNTISQSVPHLHIHIIPRRKKDGLRGFFWPRYPYKSTEEADLVQSAIEEAILLSC